VTKSITNYRDNGVLLRDCLLLVHPVYSIYSIICLSACVCVLSHTKKAKMIEMLVIDPRYDVFDGGAYGLH